MVGYIDKAPSIMDNFYHKEPDKEYYAQAVKAFGSKDSGFNNKQAINSSAQYSSVGSSISNGDIACDSYNLLEEDINNLVKLKV